MLTVAPSTASLPGKTRTGAVLPSAAVIPLNRGPRPRTVRRRFRSSANSKVVFQHYSYGTISNCGERPNLLFRHVLLPESTFPPTPSLVLRGCTDDWLRTTLLKCFRLLPRLRCFIRDKLPAKLPADLPTRVPPSAPRGTAEVVSDTSDLHGLKK